MLLAESTKQVITEAYSLVFQQTYLSDITTRDTPAPYPAIASGNGEYWFHRC